MGDLRSEINRTALGFVLLILFWLRPISVDAQASCRVETPSTPVQGLPEASGIAASARSPGVLWSHNDSGEPVLVAFSPDGAIRGRTWIAGAAVEDWEDVNIGPCPDGSCVYIADIGDNNARRGSLTIYRVPEPDSGAARSRRAESMRLTYPDGPKDAEALVVIPNGSIYIVTKGERSAVTLYRAGNFTNGTTMRLTSIATIVEGNQSAGILRQDRITGASASQDGRWIVLRTLSALIFYRTSDLESGNTREVFRYSLGSVSGRQGEGVAFAEGGTVWLSSEGGGAGRPGTIARLSCTLP
jgi:hypothetical protein